MLTQLGKTEITVPSLCLGTWSWGDKLFWNYGKNYGKKEIEKAFQTALECGLNFFDTAEVYGNGLSEELLAEFRQNSEKSIEIATKFAPLPWRFSEYSLKNALTASLKRLQVPRITLYQVHWPFTFLLSQKTLMNALADEVKQGRILAVGVSNYSAEEMSLAHRILGDRGVLLATNQVRYSLLNRQIEKQGILKTAQELGVTILAYSPLAQGLLTGKYTAKNPPAGARSFDARFKESGLKKIEPVLSLLRQIGNKYAKNMAQVALNWINAQESVIAIVGVKNSEQVKNNAGALGWKMTEEEMEELEIITRSWLN